MCGPGYIISVTLTSIALIVKSCEHEEFVVLLFALIGGRSLKICFLGLAIVGSFYVRHYKS